MDSSLTYFNFVGTLQDMRVEIVGDGEPAYAVVGGVHGDEPCGPRAIDRVLDEGLQHDTAVKYIVANEEALERNERFVDQDLNRSFPPESLDTHEARLAEKILDEIAGLQVLDLHGTHSRPVPFATVVQLNNRTAGLCRSAGVPHVAWFPDSVGKGFLHTQVDGIVVECGPQQSDEAAEMAYGVLKNFLAAEGVIDADYERSDPELFERFDTVEDAGFTFTGENLTRVEKGEVYARKNGEERVADEAFYPVFMSTSGYERILGHKAKKLGTLSEHA